MNKKALILGSLLVLPLLATLAVAFRYDPNRLESPLLGKEAPSFQLVDLEGQQVDFEALRGDPIVINFWSTWCPPCYEEHPVFLAYARRYAGQVHFIGVIYQDELSKIRNWEEQLGKWGPTLIDPGSSVSIAYGVTAPPETFFINQDGVIIEKIIGAVSPEIMERNLRAML